MKKIGTLRTIGHVTRPSANEFELFSKIQRLMIDRAGVPNAVAGTGLMANGDVVATVSVITALEETSFGRLVLKSIRNEQEVLA